jgi:ParB-like chromosome segregation protein Spo0J
MAVVRIAPNDLDLTLGRLRLLPDPAIQAMAESLRSKGQLSPMVAAEREGPPMLVDGFVRRAAALRLGLPKVTVELLDLTPIQMKTQMYLRNRERGLQLIEECRLVRDLVEGDRLSQVEVSDLLERHPSWVSRRLAIIRGLSPHLVSEGAIGRLSSGCVRKLALLPPRNQEELWAAAARTSLSPGDSAFLVDLWAKAPSAEAKAWVLEQPVAAIATARGRPQQPLDLRLGEAGEEARRTLETMGRCGLRLVHRIRDGLGDIGPEGRELLSQTRWRVGVDSGVALTELDGWLSRGAR